MSQTVDLDAALKFAISLAREAGQMIRDGQARRLTEQTGSTDQKVNSVDLVTECDQQVEKYITEQIKKEYPDHEFIGEETYDGQEITDAPTWIVDPIDGTTNFIHGFPMVACSIGLAIAGEPVVGVIYNPFLDMLYSAAKGKGAYLNESTKLPAGQPRPLPSLGEALIAVEYGSSRRDPAIGRKLSAFKQLAMDKQDGGKMVHSLRSVGSAALNVCFVASGALDVYWEIGCWPWDVCAGMCILSEAGGASYGGKEDEDVSGKPTAKIMAGRRYLFVRQIQPSQGSDVRAAQAALAKDFYSQVQEWDP